MAYPSDGDPISLQIMDYVRARLLTIQTPNYFTDVAGAELWETSHSFDSLVHPFVFIIPLTDDASPFPVECRRRRQMLLQLLLQTTFIPGSDDWKDPLFKFRTDVVHAFDTDIQLGGLCEFVQATQANVYDADQTNGVAEAVVNLSISYRHLNDNPSLTN